MLSSYVDLCRSLPSEMPPEDYCYSTTNSPPTTPTHTLTKKKDIKISPKSDDLFHAFINTIFLCRHLKPISMAIILLDVVNDLGIEYYVYVWV